MNAKTSEKPDLFLLVELLREEGFSVNATEVIYAGRLLHRLAVDVLPEKLELDSLLLKLRPIFCKTPAEQQSFQSIFETWSAEVKKTLPDQEHREQRDEKNHVKVQPSIKIDQKRSPVRDLLIHLLTFLSFVALISWFLLISPQEKSSVNPIKLENKEPSIDLWTYLKQTTSNFWLLIKPYVQELQQLPYWIWFVITAIILLWLLSKLYQRTRGTDQRILQGWSIKTEGQLLVPRLSEDVTTWLRRPTVFDTSNIGYLWRRPQIDIRRSVETSLRNLGVPTLYYRPIRPKPSYFVLIEMDAKDSRVEFYVHWAARLRKSDLDVYIHCYSHNADKNDLPFVDSKAINPREPLPDAIRRPLSLDKWPEPPAGQRLVMLSDGNRFFNENGEKSKWVERARFDRWPQRVLFTGLDFRNWTYHEKVIEKPEYPGDSGFLVLPFGDPAQASWSQWLAKGNLPEIVLSEPQRYPPLLQQFGEDVFLNEAEPSENIGHLIQQLRIYLGENGFYWLCACAGPPMINRRVVLLLGEQLLRDAGAKDHRLHYHIARNYRLLIRLPWIRRNFIPNWLRLALLANLPQAILKEVQQAVKKVIETSNNGDLTLNFKITPGLPDLRYALFLNFLSSDTPSQLSEGLPKSLSRWDSNSSIWEGFKNKFNLIYKFKRNIYEPPKAGVITEVKDDPEIYWSPKTIIILMDKPNLLKRSYHASNVRLLYEAIDFNSIKTKQVAFYNDDIGSKDFTLLKLLGSAYGWGLSFSVRRMYKALVRSYKPGDKIYLFGFSRGAFTIRTLADFICSQGILDNKVYWDDNLLDKAVFQCYQQYRSKQLAVLEKLFYKPPKKVFSLIEAKPSIEFIGVWDTVDAVGLPIDEAASFWNSFIFRYKFTNQKLHPLVKIAHHALSIDEERQSFRPLLWENDPRIEQVWFPGSHCDVGGGNPQQGFSLVTLDWMMKKAQDAGLMFNEYELTFIQDRKYVFGKLYNSRAGFGMFYRYQPRNIPQYCEENKIEMPKIHECVFKRIGQGVFNYAPLNLPNSFEVVDNEGKHKDSEIIVNLVSNATHNLTPPSLMGQVAKSIAQRRILFVVFNIFSWITLYWLLQEDIAYTGIFGALKVLVSPDGLLDKLYSLFWHHKIFVLVGAAIYACSYFLREYMEGIIAVFWSKLRSDLKKLLM